MSSASLPHLCGACLSALGQVMETYRSMSVELSNRSLAEQPMSAVQYNTKAQQLYTLVCI